MKYVSLFLFELFTVKFVRQCKLVFIRLLFLSNRRRHILTDERVCCVPMLLQIGVVLVLVIVFIVTHFTNFSLSLSEPLFQHCTCCGQIHAIVVCRVLRDWLIAFALFLSEKISLHLARRSFVHLSF